MDWLILNKHDWVELMLLDQQVDGPAKLDSEPFFPFMQALKPLFHFDVIAATTLVKQIWGEWVPGRNL